MDSGSSKRKRASEIQEWLVNEMHKLNIDSLNFTIDLQTIDEDFLLSLNDMEEKHSEIYARAIGLEEKYRLLYVVLLSCSLQLHVH